MIRIICILSLFFFGFIPADQPEIQYRNKALLKTLKKAGIVDTVHVSEIMIPDTIRERHRITGKFFRVQENVSQISYIYVGRVNSCRTGGCSGSDATPMEGNSEYFDYFILYDHHKAVHEVRVFNYQSTHGYEITARNWLKQFVGYNGSSDLNVDKNIDAISGATISAHAITFDVQAKTELLLAIEGNY